MLALLSILAVPASVSVSCVHSTARIRSVGTRLPDTVFEDVCGWFGQLVDAVCTSCNVSDLPSVCGSDWPIPIDSNVDAKFE